MITEQPPPRAAPAGQATIWPDGATFTPTSTLVDSLIYHNPEAWGPESPYRATLRPSVWGRCWRRTTRSTAASSACRSAWIPARRPGAGLDAHGDVAGPGGSSTAPEESVPSVRTVPCKNPTRTGRIKFSSVAGQFRGGDGSVHDPVPSTAPDPPAATRASSSPTAPGPAGADSRSAGKPLLAKTPAVTAASRSAPDRMPSLWRPSSHAATVGVQGHGHDGAPCNEALDADPMERPLRCSTPWTTAVRPRP